MKVCGTQVLNVWITSAKTRSGSVYGHGCMFRNVPIRRWTIVICIFLITPPYKTKHSTTRRAKESALVFRVSDIPIRVQVKVVTMGRCHGVTAGARDTPHEDICRHIPLWALRYARLRVHICMLFLQTASTKSILRSSRIKQCLSCCLHAFWIKYDS